MYRKEKKMRENGFKIEIVQIALALTYKGYNRTIDFMYLIQIAKQLERRGINSLKLSQGLYEASLK